MSTQHGGRRTTHRPEGTGASDRYSRHAVDSLKARLDAREVARRFGVSVPPHGGLVRCFIAPERHTNGDATPSCQVFARGFRCWGCGGKGDVIALAAALLGCDFRAAVDALSGDGPAPASREAAREKVRAQRAAAKARPLPPSGQVRDLWDSCRPVGDDPTVRRWLESTRRIDPGPVEDFGLARALPHGAPMPRWAQCGGRTWLHSEHRLIVPCYDYRGRLVSIRARSVAAGAEQKELAPAGYRIGGLMADPLGRRLLIGGVVGDGRTLASTYVREVGLIIAEGTPNFLCWATSRSDAAEDAPAVLGLYAGAWTPEFADRVADGTTVTLGSDPDWAGVLYAVGFGVKIAERAREGRIQLRRWTGPKP